MSLRVKLAGSVLAALALLCGYAFRTVRSICMELLTMQARAENAVTAHQTNVRDAVTALTDTWEQHGTALQFLVAGNVLGELDDSMNRLLPMLDADCDELTAELAAVKSNIRWIYDQEIMIF